MFCSNRVQKFHRSFCVAICTIVDSMLFLSRAVAYLLLDQSNPKKRHNLRCFYERKREKKRKEKIAAPNVTGSPILVAVKVGKAV